MNNSQLYQILGTLWIIAACFKSGTDSLIMFLGGTCVLIMAFLQTGCDK